MAILYAPEGYKKLTESQRRSMLNGCGSGRFGSFIVPDRILGLKITSACNIHDYMYQVGESLEDKKEADRVFLNNMTRLVDEYGGFFKRVRLKLIRKYYQAVKYFGGPSFWKDKNEAKNMVVA